MAKDYFVGFDIGSEFIHSFVLNPDKSVALAPKSKMHFGNIADTLRSIYDSIKSNVNGSKITIGYTGSGGKVIADSTGGSFFHDTLTIPVGSDYLYPECKYVFHLGSRDSYFFEKDKARTNGHFRVYVPDNATGTKCGGGSGLLLTKQCIRFFEDEIDKGLPLQDRIELMYNYGSQLAEEADKFINIGGRCGVVIQSDMIHCQNAGEKIQNILYGLFKRIALNFRNDVVGTRRLLASEKGIATGGVSKNEHIIKYLSDALHLEIIVPENNEKVGAIGAALHSMDSQPKHFNFGNLENAVNLGRDLIFYTNPLRDSLDNVVIYPEEKSRRIGILDIFSLPDEGVKSVMGIDGGSTTTKAVILESESLRPILETCIETHGKPLDAAKKIFGEIRRYMGSRINLESVVYTGSSGDFYYKLFSDPRIDESDSSDLVVDEITCHAYGVKHFNPNVDTIFELGGQDAKFTVFNGDCVKKSKMNLSCMAGTGQTMQNMIKMIGLTFNEFEEYALKADRTPIVDDTCGVFTEAGIANLISLGFSREEVAAAIAYGFIGGYVNKFVGNERFGNCISAQGGPFKNRACLAALALHTGKRVNAFPHRQLFGAYGAAIAARKNLEEI